MQQSKTIIDLTNSSQNKQFSICIVGAGGLGCQLIKNLAKINNIKILLIDYDTISQTNLNRQFCFRSTDINKPKVDKIKQYFNKINPKLQLQVHNRNMTDFDRLFFYERKFDVLISALDNHQARGYLNEMAVYNNIPMIDAGTAGYNGQVQGYMRFVSECRFCREAQSQSKQSFAVCTIRNQPQRNVHCINFALNIFKDLFVNENKNYPFNDLLSTILTNSSPQAMNVTALQIFDYLFNAGLPTNILNINRVKFTQKSSLSLQKLQENIIKQESILYQIWNIEDYSLLFIDVLKKLLINSVQRGGNDYDKDCFYDVLFVCCVTNIRIYNFKAVNSSNRLKPMSYYECKDISGKIIPVLASTNSIAAALQTINLLKLLSSQPPKYIPYTSIRGFDPQQKLSSLKPYNYLQDCTLCSPYCLYYILQADFNIVTFGQLQQYLCVNVDSNIQYRDMRIKQYIIIRNSGNKKKWAVNRQKYLKFNIKLIEKSATGLQTLLIRYVKSQQYQEYYQFLMVNSQKQSKQENQKNRQRIKIINKIPQSQSQLLSAIKQTKINQKQKHYESQQQQIPLDFQILAEQQL